MGRDQCMHVLPTLALIAGGIGITVDLPRSTWMSVLPGHPVLPSSPLPLDLLHLSLLNPCSPFLAGRFPWSLHHCRRLTESRSLDHYCLLWGPLSLLLVYLGPNHLYAKETCSTGSRIMKMDALHPVGMDALVKIQLLAQAGLVGYKL